MAQLVGRRRGRPALLSGMQCLAIGSLCEEKWRQAIEAKTDAAIRQVMAAVADEQRAADTVPLRRRKNWLESQAGRDHSENIEIALREVQGIDPETPEGEIRDWQLRVTGVQARRPKGARQRIIAEVSASQSAHFGVTISPRMVDRCWKRFRQTQSKARQEKQ